MHSARLVSQRHRTTVALLFALLLVAMQLGAQSHALEHVGDWLHRPHDAGLQLPVDDSVCAMCALFAGGSSAAPAGIAAPIASIADFIAPQRPVTSATVTLPSSYLSRAPPSTL
jgi:hypothetical protein